MFLDRFFASMPSFCTGTTTKINQFYLSVKKMSGECISESEYENFRCSNIQSYLFSFTVLLG